ncbi:MAG: hypothetical protein AAF732_05700 [Pseudomonadota bacterium]
MLLTFGLMVAFISAFPSLLALIIDVSGCSGTGGACGAVAVFAGIFLKFLAIVVFAIAMGILVFRRCRAVNMSGLWSIPAVAFVFGSSGFLFGVGNFSGANLAAGLLRLPMPYTLIALLGFGYFLATLRCAARQHTNDKKQSWSWIMAGLAATVIVIQNLPKFANLFKMVPFIGESIGAPLFALAAFVSFPVLKISNSLPIPLDLIAVITFISALVYIIHGEQDEPKDTNENHPFSASRPAAYSGTKASLTGKRLRSNTGFGKRRGT